MTLFNTACSGSSFLEPSQVFDPGNDCAETGDCPSSASILLVEANTPGAVGTIDYNTAQVGELRIDSVELDLVVTAVPGLGCGAYVFSVAEAIDNYILMRVALKKISLPTDQTGVSAALPRDSSGNALPLWQGLGPEGYSEQRTIWQHQYSYTPNVVFGEQDQSSGCCSVQGGYVVPNGGSILNPLAAGTGNIDTSNGGYTVPAMTCQPCGDGLLVGAGSISVHNVFPSWRIKRRIKRPLVFRDDEMLALCFSWERMQKANTGVRAVQPVLRLMGGIRAYVEVGG